MVGSIPPRGAKTMLYIIYYESANYCGYGEHVVVHANSEDEAKDKAFYHMEEFYREQDEEQYLEEHEDDPDFEGPWSTVITCDLFGPGHEQWEFFMMPSQAIHYPIIE